MFLNRLTPPQQGIVLMIFGIVLLLHTLDIFSSMLYYILILVSLGMIICGFMQAGLYAKIMGMIKRQQQTPPRM
jgi:uncharacterized RDD family membrane protein YckC